MLPEKSNQLKSKGFHLKVRLQTYDGIQIKSMECISKIANKLS